MEGLHNHVKSTVEAPWTYQDYDDALVRVLICPIQSFGRPGEGRSTKLKRLFDHHMIHWIFFDLEGDILEIIMMEVNQLQESSSRYIHMLVK
jgi:hypothetical protein